MNWTVSDFSFSFRYFLMTVLSESFLLVITSR